MSKRKRIIFSVMAFSLTASITGCGFFEPEEVTMVKGGSLRNCGEKTVEEMVNGFMGDPSWSAVESAEEEKYVNITGDVTLRGKEVEALLQFKIDGSQFGYNALEFNGIPQNNLIAIGLLVKMCEA